MLRVLPANARCRPADRPVSLPVIPSCHPPAVVSYVVLPVRARDLLTKKMASSLIKIGDLAVWLVGQVCVLPQAGGDARIPGATCTDATQ